MNLAIKYARQNRRMKLAQRLDDLARLKAEREAAKNEDEFDYDDDVQEVEEEEEEEEEAYEERPLKQSKTTALLCSRLNISVNLSLL